ncbi:MAG: transporter suffix domain-containing protein [Nitrospirota bacterium]|nr:transporter suffix domain-containing protein [Nitrospirota bacterium]
MSNAAAGVACLILSCLLYGGLLLVPFLPFGFGGQALTSASLVIVGEAAFWVGCLLAGRELMVRYRKRLDPRIWFRRPSGVPIPSDLPRP